MQSPSRMRVAFVMEQALGHVTHYRNIRGVVAEHATITPTWLPIPFDVHGPARFVPLFRGNWSVRASWRARCALDAALARAPHDAVLFHTQVTSLFAVGTMRRLPAVVSLDATPINYDSVGVYYNHRAAGDGLLDRQKYRMNRSVFHAAAGLVTWSEWARRSLEHDYGIDPAHVQVLAPGAAPAFFEIGARRAATQDALSTTDGDRLVRLLFVGGDFERKGGPVLFESMRGPLGDRCELHIVTGAELGSVPRNVHVHRGLGPNSAELLRLFAKADLFVLPTLADCLPLVLMEATAAGLPVITTEVGALREAVIPGTSGILVPPADAGELAAALARLVGDAELRRQMGRAGREFAQRKFDAHRNTCALLDLLVEKAQDATNGRKAA